MGQPQKSETKAFIRLVTGTLTVLTLLTAANVLMIMNSLGNNIFKPLQRNIASVATSATHAPKPIPSPTIEINCAKARNTLRVVTRANSARIMYKNCASIGRVLNERNKNQGDIFPLKNKRWTSDFISLSEGKNRLKAPLGDDIQIIEITREVPKPKASNKAL